MREYQSRFERLLGKAGTLIDLQETACFLSGLKESIRADVRAQSPTTLSTAISLARIYESKSQEVKRGFIEHRPIFFTHKTPNQGTRMANGDEKKWGKEEVLVRRFTPAELQKRRAQGLCFHCDKRYTFNHVCKRLFLIEIEEEELPEPITEIHEEEGAGDKPEIYLNTIMGITTPQTMRVSTKIGKVPLTVLIDTGSTHNFLHDPFARLAGLQTESNSSLRVVMANGEKLRSPGLCQEVTLCL